MVGTHVGSVGVGNEVVCAAAEAKGEGRLFRVRMGFPQIAGIPGGDIGVAVEERRIGVGLWSAVEEHLEEAFGAFDGLHADAGRG